MYPGTVPRRLSRSLALVAALFAIGSVGYVVIERASWWDAFYMTVITLTTVGYREVFPLSRSGEVFTAILILFGFGALFLVATEIGRLVLEGELRLYLGRARRSRMIEKMAGHEIVCGWGRMGEAVVAELRREGRSLVVVERDPERVKRLRELAVPVVEGDASSEAVLRSAGIGRARGLVVCLDADAQNVYAVLTARALNPSLFIVARAGESGAQDRLARAGADRVVNPYHLSGIRLAHLLVKPAVVDFLDVSLGADGEDLQLEQFRIRQGHPLAGGTLAGADLRRRWGVAVVAVKRGPSLLPSPEPDLALMDGDILVVVGARTALEGFEREFFR